VQNILTSDQELKGVVYKHDNFNLNALKTLQDMGEYSEFLILDGKIGFVPKVSFALKVGFSLLKYMFIRRNKNYL